ncbi:hypothetical protein FRC09_013481 [Ceratobasidium sp. 395]|nr:hypothetical protein FRC09_013481 [Ceratobasidium sp. 395]
MTSYVDSSVYVRLLFGHLLQAHCYDGNKWCKSLLNLNECLFNDDGKLVSHGSKPFNFPFDSKLDVQIEGSIIKANIKNSKGERVWAQYDLRLCLHNHGGKLKWIVTDGLFDINGAIVKGLEGTLGVGYVVAFIHSASGDAEHARRAMAAATKPAFVTIFVAATAALTGPFGLLAAGIASAAAAAGSTLVADITLEPLGRQWVTDFRVAETMPNRDAAAIGLDVLLAAVSSGAGSGINAIKNTPIKIPGAQDAVEASGFLLPSRRAGVALGAAIKGKIAPTVGGAAATYAIKKGYETVQGSNQVPASAPIDEFKGAIGPMLLKVQDIRPGAYFIVNRATNLALDLFQQDHNKEPQVVCNTQKKIRSQKWSFEKGQNGYKIRSRLGGLHVSTLSSESPRDGVSLKARLGAVEFEIYCDSDGGFRFHVAGQPQLVLEIYEEGPADKTQLTSSAIIPGEYFILNSKTATSLDLYGWGMDDGTAIKSYWLKLQAEHSNQRWIIEEGEIGCRIKSASGTYVGYRAGETLDDLLPVTANHNPVEYEIEGNAKDGYTFFVVDRWNYTLVLDLAGGLSDPGTDILFRHNWGGANQKWLVESDMEPAEIQPKYHGAYDHLIGQDLRLRSVSTDTVLDWSGGDKGMGTLYGWQAHGNKTYQRWTLERGFEGYRLKHPSSAAYVLPEREFKDGMLYLTMGLNGTEFTIDGNSQDGYVFTAVAFNPPRALDICGGNRANGTRMCLWPRHNGPTQRWFIQEFK